MGSPARSRAAGAPVISDEVPGNVCIDWRTGDAAGTDAAFARAAKVSRVEIVNQRLVANYMETRGVIAEYDKAKR